MAGLTVAIHRQRPQRPAFRFHHSWTCTAQAIADRINQQCHQSYWPCLPYAGDLNCPQVGRPDFVIGLDDDGLDGDGDGIGCE
ncbi:MAG: hypothetical protein KDB35_22040 [Acidimicrobiales bacterium]|nr:hypothetical protein [Acidimicrobiales bacterium]MCB9374006.1 hypothetical protein [Microthrixaceae bacterium]